MLGAINVLGSVMIWKTEYAMTKHRVSRRKRLRRVRPAYGTERRRAERPSLRKLSPLMFKRHETPPYAPLYEHRPAAYMMGDKLLCHPAIYSAVLAQFEQR